MSHVAPQRADLLGRIAGLVAALPAGRRVVGVDGVDGAGKTHLAGELVAALSGLREVHQASIDGFHRPREQRYARGRTAETFYRDSYDYSAFRRFCLDPFRRGSPFRPRIFDVGENSSVSWQGGDPTAGPDAVLIVDGIFLHRPELVGEWDASIWLDVPFEVSVPRGNARFGKVTASRADPRSRENARYVGGQLLYLAAAEPARVATWVVDNTDLRRPRLVSRLR